MHSDFRVIQNEDQKSFVADSRMGFSIEPIASLKLDLDADLSWAERYPENSKQKLYNSLQSSLIYRKGMLELGASYRNTLYGSPLKLGLYPKLDAFRVYEKDIQHHSTLFSSLDIKPLNVEIYAIHKHLRATPWDLDFGTFELVKKDKTGLDDIYLGMTANIKANDVLSIYAGADYKDATYAKESQYELTSLATGASFEYRINPMISTRASFIWKNRNGDAIDSQSRNHLQTTLRYQQRFDNQLSGYMLFINNNVVDDDMNELRLVSNYLRSHLIYTMPYDESHESFVLLGGKYSPENDTEAFFAQMQSKVWNSIYAGAGINIQPERLSVYQCKLGYHFSSLASLNLHYALRDYEDENLSVSQVGIGTSLYW